MPDHQDNADAAKRLRAWNRAFDPVVVIAAILPLGPLASGEDPTAGPGLAVALGSWIVFAVDFGVRTHYDRDFLRGWKGRLYLAIVVVTFPVYLLVPGLEEADLLVVSRLGWVAVLAIGGVETIRHTRLLVRRVGVAGLYASTAVFVAALVVKRVEEPEDGFATLGDGLWWAVSTITTVGYGDRVPVTATGRVTGVILMLFGLAFLGVIAASLAAHFGLDDDEPHVDRDDVLLGEIRALRSELDQVQRRLGDGGAGGPAGTPDGRSRWAPTSDTDDGLAGRPPEPGA